MRQKFEFQKCLSATRETCGGELCLWFAYKGKPFPRWQERCMLATLQLSDIYGQRISAIGVMTTRGIEDFYMVEGSVNGDIFLNFIQRCLLSVMLPFDGDNPRSVLVMDNASIHHVEAVVDLLTAAGVLIRFLPPYSPDLNPIEEVFSKVKAYVKDNEMVYQSTRNPRLLVSSAFASITIHDCNQYIKHAGYTD